MVIKSRLKFALLATAFSAALAACGPTGADSVSTPSAPTAQASNPPSGTANAGPDIAVSFPDTRAVLSGTASGGATSWSQVRGPSTVVFQNPTSPTTAIAADKPGAYVLRMTVTDAGGKTIGTDDVQFTINAAPSLNSGSTPLDHVRSFARPALAQGNTLLPLTISSCAVSSDITLELSKYWGYGALFNEGTNFGEDKLFQDAVANPGKYPIVFGQASLYGVFNNYKGQNAGYPILPPETYLRDAAGTILLRSDGNPTVSPIAPDSALAIVGEHVGRAMRRIEDATRQPIALVQNGGEYGLWIPGDNQPWDIWGRDPRVNAAMRAEGLDPTNLDDWFSFLSRNKARQERIIKETAYSFLQRSRPVAYEWYQESYGTERGRWAGWKWYTFLYEQFLDGNGRPKVSEYASPELYYNFHNSGWTGVQSQQGIPWDGLTLILRNAGGIQSLRQLNTYPWLSQGWDGGDSGGISEDDLFVGAVKAVYTSGAIGSAVGYFTCDGAPFQAMRTNSAVGARTPTQVRGLINVAKVHALFTFLEPFLREGLLLPGNGNHPFNSFADTTPAMEFDAVGEVVPAPPPASPDTGWKLRKVRVLARKMRNADRWLVTAWANTGADRPIRVTIDPRLGELTLQARRAGSVYIVELVNGQVRQRLIDEDAMNPTRNLFPGQGAL